MSETKMTAGRELDAKIASEVMGYGDPIAVRKGRTLKSTGSPMIAFRAQKSWEGDYSAYWLEDGTKLYCGKPFAPIFAPAYSTDILASGQVVEKIVDMFRDSQPYFELRTCGAFWTAVFTIQRSEVTAVADGDTAPLAICLAALEAAGAKR